MIAASEAAAATARQNEKDHRKKYEGELRILSFASHRRDLANLDYDSRSREIKLLDGFGVCLDEFKRGPRKVLEWGK
jgi:hypothetical protein